jgi:hypothetical protein
MTGPSATDVNVLAYREYGISIVYRMPSVSTLGDSVLQCKETVDESAADQSAADQSVDGLPYALDIWFGKDVLNIAWGDDGTITLHNYQPGRWWERRLSRILKKRK